MPAKPDEQPLAYQLPQPAGMTSDMVHPSVFSDWIADDNLWVPSTTTVSFKPLLFNVSHGYYVNLLRVRGGGLLSRHRHNGPVHALVLKGRWHYLEHDWIAEEGGYVYEPPGETHTLVVPKDVSEMITWFHVTAGYTYVDPRGAAQGYEDVFTRLAAARSHYASVGLDSAYIQRIIR
jgi:quercetin dioxygenase-like cupin family protein